MQLLSFVPLAAGLISSAYLALQLASAPGPLSSRFATRVIAFGSAMAAISALASGIVADLSAGRTLLFLLEVVTLAALGFDCGVIVNRDSVLAVRRLVTSMPWSQNLGHRVSSASSTLQSPGPPAVNQVGLAQSLGSHTLATGAELEQS